MKWWGDLSVKLVGCIRNFFRESPVNEHTIMRRAGGYAHKENIQKALMITLSGGIIIGQFVGDFIDDVFFDISYVSDVGGIIGLLIGLVIGIIISNVIGRFIGRFIGSIIGFVIGSVIGVSGGVIGIIGGIIGYVIGVIGVVGYVIGIVISIVIGYAIGYVIDCIISYVRGRIISYVSGRISGRIIEFIIGSIIIVSGSVIVVSGSTIGYVIGYAIGFLIDIVIDIIICIIGFFTGLIGVNSNVDIGVVQTVLFIGVSMITPYRIFVRSNQYHKWHLGYLGELAVADELHKVGCQQWRIFHGLKSTTKQYSRWQRCQRRLIFCVLKLRIPLPLTSDGCQQRRIFSVLKSAQKQYPLCKILRRVKADRCDIDHIVVCKKGVFCVETKTRRKYPKAVGEIRAEGDKIHIYENEIKTTLEDNTIDQVKNNVVWLHNKINEHCYNTGGKKLKEVIPIIIFPGWCITETHNEIKVCNLEQISGVFADIPDNILCDCEVKKICEFLEKATEMDLIDAR